jgi:hypothetical protein
MTKVHTGIVTIDVDVHLDDIDEYELIEELKARGYFVGKKDERPLPEHINSMVMNVYLARVLSAPNLDEYLNELFNEVLNRSI